MLTKEIFLGLMFVLLFASFETTSLALTLAIKFLSDHPAVLKKLTEEHGMIIKQRENADAGLTWKEYKSMTFTFQIINETVRLANIVPAIFRKAIREIQFKGHTIPEGWAVMVCGSLTHWGCFLHMHPTGFHPDPLLRKYCTLLLQSHSLHHSQEVIAAITYQIVPTNTQYAEIPIAAVSSMYQHKGFGSSLLLELKKRLQSVGICTIFCWGDKESEGFWLKQIRMTRIWIGRVRGRRILKERS